MSAAEQRPPGSDYGLDQDFLAEYDIDLNSLLDSIGVSVDEYGVLHEPGGRDIRCYNCSEQLTPGNVGFVVPGRYYFYCRKRDCLEDGYKQFG
jgi:hypothetical protein